MSERINSEFSSLNSSKDLLAYNDSSLYLS